MNEQYVKTGEDKNFEYYRNDSEVVSGDGEEEIYQAILYKKKEFNVKINNNDIKIKKRTLNKIMILSENEPEEQILFSHYKTVSHDKDKSKDKEKAPALPNENKKAEKPNNPEDINANKSIPSKKINEPLSENNNNNNNNNNIAINVNIPPITNNDNNKNDDNDNEKLILKKKENTSDKVLVALPPEGVKLKWFYLLLALCGIANVVYFFIIVFGITFILNTLPFIIFGIIDIFTGLFGFITINKRIYNNTFLFILTVLCAILPIANIALIFINGFQNAQMIFGLIVNPLTIIFAILCIIFTKKFKQTETENKIMQTETLL